VGTWLRTRAEQQDLLTQRDRAELLYRVSRELSAELDLDALLSRTLELTTDSLGTSRGSIILLDEEGNVRRLIFFRRGRTTTVTDNVWNQVLQDGLAAWVIENRQGVHIADTNQDPRWLSRPDPEEGPTTRSVITTPLVRNDRVIGVLTLGHENLGHFTRADLDLLNSIALQAAIVIEKAGLFETVERERGRLEAILTSTDDAIVAIDGAGRITLLNPAAEQIFELSFEKIAREPLADTIPLDPLLTAIEEAQRGEQPSVCELALPRGPTLSLSISPVAGPEEETGWVITMQDISHLKELDQMKDAFISTVSHDLCTPLATISGFAELIEKTTTGDTRDYARHILESTDQMTKLVRDLLDLGKIEAGMTRTRTPCQLGPIIEKAAGQAEMQALLKGIILTTVVTPTLQPVEGDPQQLRQVLDNLLSNAIKYTSSGGKVDVRAWEKNGTVTITVQDSGIGIPPEAFPRVFEKFFRIQHPETRDIPGTGLGLTIAKAIVEQHGGRIWVESKAGQGSTFFLTLPSIERGPFTPPDDH
jgi:PAS domain S-box-containing protein